MPEAQRVAYATMRAKRLWVYPILLAGLFVACGEKDPEEITDPCPDGTDGCECFEDLTCSGTLSCLQGKCFSVGMSSGDSTGSTTATGTSASGDTDTNGDGDTDTGGDGDGGASGDGGAGGAGGVGGAID